MKWLLLIVTMIVKRFAHLGTSTSSPIEDFKDLVKENAVKVWIALTASIAVGTLFVAGLVLTVINLTAQYDAGIPVRFTGIVAGAVGLLLVSLLVFAIAIFYATAHDRMQKKIKKQKQKEANSLEEALVLLVQEFIQEREFKRTHPTTSTEEEVAPNETRFKSEETFERH